MDFLPIAVLIVFVFLGGAIAVIADELGRRIGKKRLQLHRKIRPKTSARIMAFGSGVIITLMTIILITVASSDVRAWIQHGASAIRERDQLALDLKGKRQDIKALEDQRKVLENENSNRLTAQRDLQRQIGGLKKQLTAYESKLSDSKAKMASATSRIAFLNGRMASLNKSIAATIEEKRVALLDLKAARKSLLKLRGDYDYLAKDYKEMLAHDTDLDHKLQAKEKEVSDKEKEIAEKSRQVSDAEANIAKLKSDKASLEKEVEGVQHELDQRRQEYTNLSNDLAQLRQANYQNMTQSRFRPLIFSMGEELARISIPAGASKEQVRGKIDSALAAAKQLAKESGAKQANRVDYADLVDDTDPSGNSISPDTQKDLLAASLAGGTEDRVLLVLSFANAFADEGVIVKFAQQPNPVVYQPGQTLAEIRINSREEPAKILEGLSDLGTRIRTRALNDKMIPVQRRDFSFGTVSPDDVWRLVDDIKKSGGSVKVRATAKRLTRAADPLMLDFEVR